MPFSTEPGCQHQRCASYLPVKGVSGLLQQLCALVAQPVAVLVQRLPSHDDLVPASAVVLVQHVDGRGAELEACEYLPLGKRLEHLGVLHPRLLDLAQRIDQDISRPAQNKGVRE